MTYRPTYLSVSAVQTYVACPKAWKLRYVDKLAQPTSVPMLFGTVFHKALEAEHRGEDSERALIAAWNIADADLAASGQQMHPGKAHALDLLNEYRARGLGGKLGHAERKFTLRLLANGLPPVVGYIDLTIPERRRFREFKTTSGTSWNATKIALEFQLHVYGRAYQSLHSHRPDCGEYVIFGTDRVYVDPIEVVPSADGFRMFELAAAAMWKGINAQQFDGCGKQDCWACKVEREPAQTGPSVLWEEAAS
jgi:hypothetical protein